MRSPILMAATPEEDSELPSRIPTEIEEAFEKALETTPRDNSINDRV